MQHARTLRAAPASVEALRARHLEAKAALLRARVEADPGCGQGSKLTRAEHDIYHRRLDEADTALTGIEKRLNERAEESEVEAYLAEAEDQALRDRGVETIRTEKGPATRDGWLWLVKKKGRLTLTQREAGMKWSNDYGLTRTDGVRSCLNDSRGGSDRAADLRADASRGIGSAREHIRRAVGHDRLGDLLDAVCGRGQTVREIGKDDRAALIVEAELKLALDMAAVAYGVVRV